MSYLPLFDDVPSDPPPETSVVAPAARFRVVLSPSAALRLERAREALRRAAPGSRVLVVGASRPAADDLVRKVAAAAPATFGVERLSFAQLAARTALHAVAASGASASTRLGAEAVATRALFEAVRAESLGYFAPVAQTPGFPRALAATLHELRLAGVASTSLASLRLTGPDLAALLDRFDAGFAAARAVDRADVFRTATAVLREARARQARTSVALVVLLDVPLEHASEREFVAALAADADGVLATVPHGDRETLGHLTAIGAAVEEAATDRPVTDLSLLGRFLFEPGAEPPLRELDGSVAFFSAPGEGRESVEIARRVMEEARGGVRFDEMAVLVRSPRNYFGLLEHALGRAGVPAWFDRGARRPHPAGRAFLALLACASEQLSAARFAEYLSLGQVPALGESAHASLDALPADEGLGLPEAVTAPPAGPEVEASRAELDVGGQHDGPIVAGTLRAPWKWETLLVDAAVIGRDASRWRRRLSGKAAEIDRQVKEVEREEGDDSARVLALRQVQQQLGHLRDFALPIVDALAAWPRQATWGEWLAHFARLVPDVLRSPGQVLRVLADLRPMSDVGPIDLDEARRVLSERLLTLESEPPPRRFGRIFVGTPEQARGRSFRVVFVPGLAERMFPQKPREDPLLLDTLREQASSSLATQSRRLHAERLLLQLAAGAASDRLYLSYPRIELTESRARVPSFYALDVIRAATGRIPDFEALESGARDAGRATLAWPAPPDPDAAIDEQEHDLAVLRQLLDEKDHGTVKGHAHYLLKLNECLRRSVVGRWARGEPRWSPSDGLMRVTADTAPALAAQRLTARSYSLSALQRFSACPYQFVLAAVYRLQPFELPESLQRMDPLTRGSLFHDVQARFFRALEAQQALPVTSATVAEARAVLDETLDAVAVRRYDELAPAVDRVWHDEIASIRRDLHGWLSHLAQEGEEWRPSRFEFGFGPVPGERDRTSIANDVTLTGGYRLRGAVDLIEEHRKTSVLRVTDHKTGRRPERIERVIVGGGAVLQPVLYAMAIEGALAQPVSAGRLFYCTSAGGYVAHTIPLSESTRAAGLEVLQVIDRAIEQGALAAAPTPEACGRCDYRVICGPGVSDRVRRKPAAFVADLDALRSRP